MSVLTTSSSPLNVVFVTPPNRDFVCSSLVQLNNDEGIGLKPPLGLLYVASSVVARSAHTVHVIDSAVGDLDYSVLVDKIVDLRPNVVGITAWTDFWYPTVRTLQLVKERLPNVFTVVGGPHTLVFPAETLAHPSVDAVVVGDGEAPMLALLDSLARNGIPRGVPGLHLASQGLHQGLIHVEKRVDSLPHLDRTLLPLEPYSSVLGQQALSTTLVTSRGCPYACVYCKIHQQKPMMHSARYVLEEFDRVHDLGISEVEVYDDTFTWSHERVHEICNGLINRGYNIRWSIRDRVNNVREDTLTLMRKAGCNRIHYGIESGSDEVLDRVKKRITTDQARHAVTLAQKAGFQVLAFFMMGLPGETLEDVRRTIDFSLRLPADYCQYSIAVAYPGTEMYIDGLRDGSITHDFWREFAMNPVPNFHVPTLSFSHIGPEELLRLRNEAVRRFYFRPRILINELWKLRSLKEFKRKAAMGLSLLSSVQRGHNA
jgi:radical SAM superfamily enzyme YgiQ (UPF0313 family)